MKFARNGFVRNAFAVAGFAKRFATSHLHCHRSQSRAVLAEAHGGKAGVNGGGESRNVLNPDEVRRLARLARLQVSDEELPSLCEDLSKIVSLVDQLAEVPTDGVEPMVHAFDLQNVLASDRVEPSLARDDVLSNAPSHDGECFLVPAVLG